MRLIKGRDVPLFAVQCLIRWAGKCPSLSISEGIPEVLGRIACLCSRSWVRSARSNLRAVFGAQLSATAQKKVIRESWCGRWREMLTIWPSEVSARHLGRMDVQGLQYLREALEQGHGAILWEANYFGYRHLSKQYLRSQGFPIYQLQSDQHWLGRQTYFSERVLRPFFLKCQSQFLEALILVPNLQSPNSGSLAFTRALVQRLKENNVVAVGGAGDVSRKFFSVDFFGQRLFFAAGAFSLARWTGAPVIPVFCFWNRASERFSLSLGEPIHVPADSEKDSTEERCLLRCVKRYEEHIRMHPEQYWLWHRDFKDLFSGVSR